MSLFLFLELWMLLVNVPPIALAACNKWMERLNTYVDASWNMSMDSGDTSH